MFAALLFVCGFSTVFIAFGASASAIGRLVLAYSPQLAIVAGIVIIIMGLHFLGLTRIAVLMREKRAPMSRPVGLWGAYVMGLAFAFGWTPCIGPILAAILAVAASRETVGQGAGLLAVYSAGLGIPFLIAAFAVEPAMAAIARFRGYIEIVEKVMGALLVLTGIAFLTGMGQRSRVLAAGDVSGAGEDWVSSLSTNCRHPRTRVTQSFKRWMPRLRGA